jgi:hypothetical protein
VVSKHGTYCHVLEHLGKKGNDRNSRISVVHYVHKRREKIHRKRGRKPVEGERVGAGAGGKNDPNNVHTCE